MTEELQKAENANTYVIDPESGAEMARLLDQDQLVTRSMGGLFPPDWDDLPEHARILDIACGPGGWALEVAHRYPDAQIVGIDISRTMTEYATAQALVQNLTNVQFQVMDIRQPLQFEAESFTFVQARFVSGVLSQQGWPALLQELERITAPGGCIRLMEPCNLGMTNSAAFTEMEEVLTRAWRKDERTKRAPTIIPLLPAMLEEAGCENVQERAHVFNFSFGKPMHQMQYYNLRAALKLMEPFAVGMQAIGQEEYNALYERVLDEVQQEGFRGLWFHLETWGQKPAAS